MKGAAGVAGQGSNMSSSRGDSGSTWVAEWAISFDLMQIAPGKPYAASMAGEMLNYTPRQHSSINAPTPELKVYFKTAPIRFRQHHVS